MRHYLIGTCGLMVLVVVMAGCGGAGGFAGGTTDSAFRTQATGGSGDGADELLRARGVPQGFSVESEAPTALRSLTFNMPRSRFTCTAFYGTNLTCVRWVSHLPPPAEVSPIAFAAREGSGPYRIWLTAPDGSWIRCLTRGKVRGAHPSWSPDGTRVAFTRKPDPSDIWTMNAAGGDLQRVTNTPLRSGAVAWSPDGTRLAFKEGIPRGAYDLFTICPDGSDRRQISSNPHEDRGAEWSPDGSQLVFLSNGTGDKEIHMVDAEGANLKRLTHDAGDDCAPAWHPDGSRIVFSSSRDGSKDLYVMGTDGSQVRQLTNDQCASGHSDWSPDGRKICYHYRGRGVSELRAINADGSGKTTVVGAPYTVCCTAWIVRHSKRVLVGSPEADAGYDPPLGDGVQAVVVIHDDCSLRSVIGITSQDRSPVRVVLATEIGELDVRSEDQVQIAESIWIGQPSAERVGNRDGVRRCRLSFDPRTGRLGSCTPRRRARTGVDL